MEGLLPPNTTVLLVGIILLATTVLVRTLVEGTGWWRVFLRGGDYEQSAIFT